MEFNVPFTKDQVKEWNVPTPFHVYDEKAIVENAKKFLEAFSWAPGFKNYYAVKACPNPYIIKILKALGMGTDCSSLPELMISEKVGITGEEIMFTSNDTPAEEFVYAKKIGAIINLDDISHIESLEKSAGMPELICFRYNPGPLKVTGCDNVIGNPEDAKYGFTKEQLIEGYNICKEKGVKRFGLHTMVVSNELKEESLIQTARLLFEVVLEIKEKTGIVIEFVNLGGGIGIPYKLDDKPVALQKVSEGIKKLYDELIVANGIDGLKIVMENGRFITGPYGYLVMKVRHMKHIYKDYVGMDACMTDNMRPAIYGAYHHINVLGKEGNGHKYDVTGSLCENNDKFAIDRVLPEIEVGDILVQHNDGAHTYAMGFNYNGKLRSAEYLLKEDGSIEQIRRAETTDDLFATLDFSKL